MHTHTKLPKQESSTKIDRENKAEQLQPSAMPDTALASNRYQRSATPDRHVTVTKQAKYRTPDRQNTRFCLSVFGCIKPPDKTQDFKVFKFSTR